MPGFFLALRVPSEVPLSRHDPPPAQLSVCPCGCSIPHPDGARHPLPQKRAEKMEQHPKTLTWEGKWGLGDRMTSQRPRKGSCFLPKTIPLLRCFLDTTGKQRRSGHAIL